MTTKFHTKPRGLCLSLESKIILAPRYETNCAVMPKKMAYSNTSQCFIWGEDVNG